MDQPSAISSCLGVERLLIQGINTHRMPFPGMGVLTARTAPTPLSCSWMHWYKAPAEVLAAHHTAFYSPPCLPQAKLKPCYFQKKIQTHKFFYVFAVLLHFGDFSLLFVKGSVCNSPSVSCIGCICLEMLYITNVKMSCSTTLVFLGNFRAFPPQAMTWPCPAHGETLGLSHGSGETPGLPGPPQHMDTSKRQPGHSLQPLRMMKQSSMGVPPQTPPSCLTGLPSLAKALPTPALEIELLRSLEGALTQKAKDSPITKINSFVFWPQTSFFSQVS